MPLWATDQQLKALYKLGRKNGWSTKAMAVLITALYPEYGARPQLLPTDILQRAWVHFSKEPPDSITC